MKKNSSQYIWVIGLILVAVVFLGRWPHSSAKEVVPWRTDFAAATAEARRVNKPLFVEFSASWCGPCREMGRTVWSDPAVAAVLAETVPVKIDVDAHQDLAEHFDVRGIPFMAVLDADGKPVKSSTGFISAQDFISWFKGR